MRDAEPGSRRRARGPAGRLHQSALPVALRREVEELVRATSIGVLEITSPWESATRTHVMAMAGGERIVLQWTSDRAGVGRRIRLGQLLPQRAPLIPWAQMLAGNATAEQPFVVTRFVPGIRGSDMLGNDRDAASIAAQMGRLVPEIAGVSSAGLRLSAVWGDSERLGAAAGRWLARSEAILGSGAASSVRRMIEGAPGQLGAARPTFAHGDFAPVNVIVRDGAIAALIDLERARLAHPLFDSAWWRLMIRSHHPERWPAAGPPFFAAAGLHLSTNLVSQLDLLAVLQCLEMIASAAQSQPTVRASWASRLQAVLDWR